MLRLSSLLVSAALLFLSTHAETIVSDNFGHALTLPLTTGTATRSISEFNSPVSTSPYVLSVYINNGEDNGINIPPIVPSTVESYYFEAPSNGALYGAATLVGSAYSRAFSTSLLTAASPVGQYLGGPNSPVTSTGLYQFTFTIPVLESIYIELMYRNVGNFESVTLVTIEVLNPAAVVGDPQFVGLRGQTYQIHGIDGAVYNIITETNTHVNSRFVFLNRGACPVINGTKDVNCWSHPGSYLGEMSFQQVVDGKLHQVLVTAGSAETGFDSIVVDNEALRVGDSLTFGTLTVLMESTHHVSIQTENYSFELSNSDKFINQAVSNRVALNQLSSHGLLGQTHAAKAYSTAIRYIEGEIDDYVIADNDIFGTSFTFSKFQI